MKWKSQGNHQTWSLFFQGGSYTMTGKMTPGLLNSRRDITRDIVGPRGAFSSLQCLECWGEWCRCKTNHLSPLSKRFLNDQNISNDQKILNSAGQTHLIPNVTSNLKQCGLYRFVRWGISLCHAKYVNLNSSPSMSKTQHETKTLVLPNLKSGKISTDDGLCRCPKTST